MGPFRAPVAALLLRVLPAALRGRVPVAGRRGRGDQLADADHRGAAVRALAPHEIKPIHLVAGGLGVFGVGLLVLRSNARLDVWGLLAMTTA